MREACWAIVQFAWKSFNFCPTQIHDYHIQEDDDRTKKKVN